jgi:hypothetical protein
VTRKAHRARKVVVEWRVDGDAAEGRAFDAAGKPLVTVAGTLGYYGAVSLDDLIDRFLSPALDAHLDVMVGPLAWKQVTRQ